MQDNFPVVPAHAVGQIVDIHETILNGEKVFTVGARELHGALNVGREFSTWIKGRIAECGFVENDDYLLAEIGEQLPSGTKYKKEYELTLDMAKHLSMMERNDTGHKVRQGFIDYEKRTRAILAAPANNLPAPRDPFQTLQLHYDVLAKHDSDIKSLTSRADQVEEVALEAMSEIEYMKNSRPLLPHQCHAIQKAVAEKVNHLSEKHNLAYRPVIFSAIYGFLKRHFQVNTYSAIAAIRFEEAFAVVKNLVLEQLPDKVANLPKHKEVTA